MTDLSTEPVVAPAAPEAPPDTPPTPDTAPADDTTGELAHTPGGYPVLPLALSGANTTAGVIGAGGLAGGPIGAAAAAGGVALLGSIAALTRARRLAAEERKTDPRAATTGRTTTPAKGAGTGSGARKPASPAPSQGRGSRAGGTSSNGSRTGGPAGRGKTGNARTASPSSGRSGPSKAGGRTGSGRGGLGKHKAPAGRTDRAGGAHKAPKGLGARSGTAGGGAGKLSQARAARAANTRQNPTRSAARNQAKQDRRAVADARRDAKTAARQAKDDQGRGRLGRAAAWGGRKAASGARALINRARDRRDRATDAKLADQRAAARKAPARRKARWALWRSAARMFGRRVLAGVLGGALGLVGFVTSPIGRKLGIPWLIHPGRRLYRRMVDAARMDRALRDAQIRKTRGEEEAKADADAAGHDAIGDRVERPARLIPVSYPTASEVVNVSGFKFEEAASEMQNAAATYDPDTNMEVVEMIDNLPAALECVAKTFLILAERSDQEFAFEKQVADGFDDIYKTLLNAVDSAVELGPFFRQVHEQDIARHEDPRNGSEAEKKWNV
ncbi:hypothetical protein OG453_00240 [Streptomyces sp. NBC_01381]|uniref:hypothetical protein n=1 Tax=Streptomyces sp. NBC_01381 TaxID=2903845 RepID=UPI00225BA2BD|nr:hypothetical protein [Streptomyces sp. NBC_01381]MCX4665114.1 hypothetical protein [Streptomyces sp. NBC_01381]